MYNVNTNQISIFSRPSVEAFATPTHIGITKRSFNVFQVVEKKKRFYLLDSLAFSCAVLLERWAAPEGADLSPWKNSFILETMVVLAEAVPVAEVAEDDTEAEPLAKQIWPLLWTLD